MLRSVGAALTTVAVSSVGLPRRRLVYELKGLLSDPSLFDTERSD